MYHQTTVIGYLGGDPEVRYLPSGSAVVEFSVATTEKWKDKNSGEGREHTEWYNCRCFGKLAEVIAKSKKERAEIDADAVVRHRAHPVKPWLIQGQEALPVSGTGDTIPALNL